MFCPNCGIKTEEGAQFCQGCGSKTDSSTNAETTPTNQTEVIKNYAPIFWRYFWVGVLLNVFSKGVESVGESSFWIVFFIFAGIYIFKFSWTINEAMASIGKKNWWPLGLLAFIPFGFWIAFLIVRAKLKPHGKWISEHKSFRMSKKL